jgi:hypothetical protein
MKDLQTLLREGDPLTREPELPMAEADRIRRLLLREARHEPRRVWLGAALLGFASVMTALAVVVAGRGEGLQTSGPSRPATSNAIVDAPPTRQLQFATPGGTRVIWVFDSTFDVR